MRTLVHNHPQQHQAASCLLISKRRHPLRPSPDSRAIVSRNKASPVAVARPPCSRCPWICLHLAQGGHPSPSQQGLREWMPLLSRRPQTQYERARAEARTLHSQRLPPRVEPPWRERLPAQRRRSWPLAQAMIYEETGAVLVQSLVSRRQRCQVTAQMLRTARALQKQPTSLRMGMEQSQM